MTRVLRFTPMSSPDSVGPTMVLTEDDLQSEDIEQAVESLVYAPKGDETDGMFVYYDVLDLPTNEISQATASVIDLMRSEDWQRIRNMAILYYWTVGHFRLMVENGTIATKDPAPLTLEDIKIVLRQLAKHPGRRTTSIIATSQDGGMVCVEHNGDVTVSRGG